MVMPHYTYLVLKIPGPRGIISIKGDIKQPFDCDRESCEIADRLTVFIGLQELKHALAVSPPPPPRPSHARGQDLQDIHPTGGHTQQDDSVVYEGAFQV
jgi:hypothetical protein